MVYGMHPFPAFGSSKPSGYSEQYSGAELIRRTVATAGLRHSFLTNVQNFQSEAALWVTVVLMSGFFDRRQGVLPRLQRVGYEYTLADPKRLFFAALIPMQHTDYRRSAGAQRWAAAWRWSVRWMR